MTFLNWNLGQNENLVAPSCLEWLPVTSFTENDNIVRIYKFSKYLLQENS